MLQVWFMQGLGNLGFGQVLEFGQSKVNFVFFGGKAMLVPLCLDRRIDMPNSRVGAVSSFFRGCMKLVRSAHD